MIRQDRKSSVWGIYQWDVAVAASFLLLLAALGCSQEKKQVSAATGEAWGGAVVAVQAATPAGGNSAPRTTSTEGVGEIEGSAIQSGGLSHAPAADDEVTLPPEVVANVSDSLAVPGSVVEITAEGSSDVIAITLSDGRGQSRPFVFDAATSVWRAAYRVPLRSTTERLGLSATATNGGNRWKRVWIFLNVLPKQTTASAQTGDGC